MLNIRDIKRNCRVVLHQKCMNPSSYKTTEELEPFIKVVKAAICDGDYHGQFETINFFTLPGKGGGKVLGESTSSILPTDDRRPLPLSPRLDELPPRNVHPLPKKEEEAHGEHRRPQI